MEVLPFWIGLISGSIVASIIIITISIVDYYRLKKKMLESDAYLDSEFRNSVERRLFTLEDYMFQGKINERGIELENKVFSFEDNGG